MVTFSRTVPLKVSETYVDVLEELLVDRYAWTSLIMALLREPPS
jgi:hypothetical protein